MVGAVLISGGRLLLTPGGNPPLWHLVEGELLPEHPDTETAMDLALERFGISAPAVEEDFLDTILFDDGEVRTVYNLYAPTDWAGEPSRPDGGEVSWMEPATLHDLPMDEHIRGALLTLFGLKTRADGRALVLDAGKAIQDPGKRLQVEPPEARPDPAAEFAGALASAKSSPGLPPSTSALIRLALSAGAGGATPAEFEDAFVTGSNEAEIGSVLRLVAVYAGNPAALSAATVFEKVIRERNRRDGR